jgi:hypothetical protein
VGRSRRPSRPKSITAGRIGYARGRARRHRQQLDCPSHCGKHPKPGL